MSYLNTSKGKLLIVGSVFLLILGVYAATYALDSAAEVRECQNTSFEIVDVCFDSRLSSLANMQTSVRINVRNTQTDINGFTVRIFGSESLESAAVFKTVPGLSVAEIQVPYEPGVAGEVRRIEMKPMLNIRQSIYRCGPSRGAVFHGPVALC